jgi:diketogulonate reductase-like aldo/keto reductase
MGIRREIVTERASAMFDARYCSIHTAPTYQNEEKIGSFLQKQQKNSYIIAKIPKRMVTVDEVRDELIPALANASTRILPTFSFFIGPWMWLENPS